MGPEEAVEFADRAAWRSWLSRYHASDKELWVVHHKKRSPHPGLRYEEGVEEALCFGWIDSKALRLDEDRYAQRYSPRKPTSVWSRSNVERVERLIAEGRMTPAGLALVEEAKRRGSWQAAYTDRKPVSVPDDLEQALRSDPAAWDAFLAFANSYRNQYVMWVASARTEPTRLKRIAEVVLRSKAGKKPGVA